jgi:hypothetical protein
LKTLLAWCALGTARMPYWSDNRHRASVLVIPHWRNSVHLNAEELAAVDATEPRVEGVAVFERAQCAFAKVGLQRLGIVNVPLIASDCPLKFTMLEHVAALVDLVQN